MLRNNDVMDVISYHYDIYMYVYLYTYAYMYIYICVYIYICMILHHHHICIHMYHTCMILNYHDIYVYVHTHMCVYIYIFICIYIYIHHARMISIYVYIIHVWFQIIMTSCHLECLRWDKFRHSAIALAMEWLRSVGSFKSYVSFAEHCLFCRALVQKIPIILRSLLIVATP